MAIGTADGTWELTGSAGLMAATAATMIALAALGWRRRATTAMPHLIVGMLCTTWWALAYALELTAPAGQVQLWGTLKYVGIVALPPVWVSFVAVFTRGRPLSGRMLALLAVEPVVVLALLTDPRTDQLIRYYNLDEPGRVAATGPLFWVHLAYTSLLLWAATVVLVASLWRQPYVYRRRAQLLVATLLVPWVLNLLFDFAVAPFETVDLTPFAFLASEAVLLWGIAGIAAPELRRMRRSDVFAAVREPVLVLDGKGRVVDANPAAERVLGTRLQLLVGGHVTDVVPNVSSVLSTTDPSTAAQVELHLDGRTYDVTVTPRTDRKGQLTSALLTAHDVTSRKAAEREFERRSQHDPLTGLPNREVFLRRLTAASAAGTTVCVLYVDVDNFKHVNDEHGHMVGDAVLVEIAARLRDSVRDDDLVSRLGGDEFAILLADPVSPRRLPLVAAHVVNAFEQPLSVDGEPLDLHVSVGAAAAVGTRGEELLSRADSAMYAAKRDGRACFRVWSPPSPVPTPLARRHQVGPSPGSSW